MFSLDNRCVGCYCLSLISHTYSTGVFIQRSYVVHTHLQVGGVVSSLLVYCLATVKVVCTTS